MATQVQIRGATQATQEGRTLASRELDVNTTSNRLAVHNGSTQGGIPHATFRDIQNQFFNYAVATGTNSLSITLAKAPSAYADGQKFSFRAANNNTGSATLNVNSLGAITLYKIESGTIVTLDADDIVQNGIYEVTYSSIGPAFIITGISGSSGRWDLIETQTPVNIEYQSFINIPNGCIEQYELINVIPVSDGESFQLQFSSNNGSSYIAGSSYEYGLHKHASDTATSSSVQSSGGANIRLSDATDVGSAAGESGVSGTITINNVNNSTLFKTVDVNIVYVDTGGSSVSLKGSGIYPIAATAINALRFMFNGNIESGTIRRWRSEI